MTATACVAIIFLNKADQTRECISAFAKPGIPVYVLNNGSTEAAALKVKQACDKFPNVHFIHSTSNLGCGGGRNLIIKNSKEDWILFVDNDIVPLEEHWLDNLMLHIQHSKEVDAIVPVIHNIWDGTKIRAVNLGVVSGQATFTTATSAYTNVFPGGASFISRNLFNRVGVYDDSLFAFEDFEVSLRAERAGYAVVSKHITDVNFLHDHRVVTNDDDRQAVNVRYSLERVGRAHDIVQNRYAVSFDKNYKVWLEQQVLELTEPEWSRTSESNIAADRRSVVKKTPQITTQKPVASRLWKHIKDRIRSR